MASPAKQTDKNHTFLQALRHAWAGVRVALHKERNLRRDAVAAIVVIGAAAILRARWNDWLWLLAAIWLVIFAELGNTLMEDMVDFVTKGAYSPQAKKIKDLSAGIVLLTAFFAVLVGALVFIPLVWAYFR
ncbi:diacylglycerol kinase family protein [Schleiferilactobacillus harbinensis]|uniref:diacylglycerol kinase family protein n=1 Tax=Schleiferilactobacillus harbinensis TaxID=304207 RepID=UPI001AAE50C6|nr:diacylglycerol kinase family protein [Schleiferilactobacillus harbinensis]MBO3091658.1 diacylglycerol kinase family protein [Schleiferilactobacillus harbinensis]